MANFHLRNPEVFSIFPLKTLFATEPNNVFVERLWRSVKYEDIYLRAYESPAALLRGLTQYIQFYNAKRRHQMLNRQTPDAVYFGDTKEKTAA